jgi:hypothetical protein
MLMGSNHATYQNHATQSEKTLSACVQPTRGAKHNNTAGVDTGAYDIYGVDTGACTKYQASDGLLLIAK